MSDEIETNDESTEEPIENSGNEDTNYVAEEKKPINRSTLVLMLLVAAGGGTMYLMHLKTGPSAAMAAAPEAMVAEQRITTFLSDNAQNMKGMETMLRGTQKIVQEFLNYPKMTQVPLKELQTNPFRFMLQKADAGDATSKRQLEEARETARTAAKALQLQSVFASGSRKACMINGTVCTEGQQVGGCVVEKINGDKVIVRRGVFRFQLAMKQ